MDLVRRRVCLYVTGFKAVLLLRGNRAVRLVLIGDFRRYRHTLMGMKVAILLGGFYAH